MSKFHWWVINEKLSAINSIIPNKQCVIIMVTHFRFKIWEGNSKYNVQTLLDITSRKHYSADRTIHNKYIHIHARKNFYPESCQRSKVLLFAKYLTSSTAFAKCSILDVLRCSEYTSQMHCSDFPAGKYKFKVNKRNTITRREICSKLTIKTTERCHGRGSSVFIINFKHISHLALLLLTLSRQMPTGFKMDYNVIK